MCPIYLNQMRFFHKNCIRYMENPDFPVCDILISFEESNPEGTSLGYAAINFSSSTHKYVHIISFLNANAR